MKAATERQPGGRKTNAYTCHGFCETTKDLFLLVTASSPALGVHVYTVTDTLHRETKAHYITKIYLSTMFP